jgi:hypothetical protein
MPYCIGAGRWNELEQTPASHRTYIAMVSRDWIAAAEGGAGQSSANSVAAPIDRAKCSLRQARSTPPRGAINRTVARCQALLRVVAGCKRLSAASSAGRAGGGRAALAGDRMRRGARWTIY